MVFAHMGAGGKGVQALDAMGKALIHQKLQRAVGDGRLVAEAFGGKAGEDVIGPQRLVFLQQDLQNPAADRGHSGAGRPGQRLGPVKGVLRALGMVMCGKGQVGHRAAGAIVRIGHGAHSEGLTCYDITYTRDAHIHKRRRNRKARKMRYIIALALTATPALAEVPRVVTDIPPVHALVAQVMGELGQPELLLAKGADEHDFQLKPSQAGAVADADLVVWIGPGLTPWLGRALESRPEGAAALGLLDAEGTLLRNYGDAGTAGSAAAATPVDQDHRGDAGHDPHVWLDPDNAVLWLGLIAAELGRLDPDNAAIYAENARVARDGIATLEAEVTAILAPVRDKPLVTFHDAFGYFSAHFGLTVIGSIALGDAASPGAARLAKLRATMQAGDVLCIFPEVQYDPVLVTRMAEGTGARIGGALDPVGSSLEPGPGAYAALLTGLARTMAECAGG